MAQLAFHVDTRHCINCKTCQIACKDKHDLGVGPIFRRVTTFEGGKYPQPWVFHLSMSCNHCTDPACVKACPTTAMYKRAEDGVVVVDKSKCVGCRYCTWACPYDAISYLEDEGKVGKCDFCIDLIAEGKNPACVDACVMRIIHYGKLQDMIVQYGNTRDIVGLPDSSMTEPCQLLTPKPIAVKKT